jgi:hypothetical protein
MKSSFVLPPLSDILNSTTINHPYHQHHHHHREQSRHYQRTIQVSSLLSCKDIPNDYEDYEYEDNEPVKAKRKRASPSQLIVLNRVFEQTFFPSTELRMELGMQLGMSPRTVQIWFQNKRQSIRTRERHIVSPPISPSIQHNNYFSQKPAPISLPALRLPQLPTFPLTPTSSAHSSPTAFDNSILFRDY